MGDSVADAAAVVSKHNAMLDVGSRLRGEVEVLGGRIESHLTDLL
jgi:hypothetical protein